MRLFPPIFTMGIRIVTTLIVKGLQIGGKKVKSVMAYSQPRCASGEFGVIRTFRHIRIEAVKGSSMLPCLQIYCFTK
jgi:hypothetical protein